MKNKDISLSDRSSAFSYVYSMEEAILSRRVDKRSHSIADNKGWMGVLFLSGNSVLMTPLEEIAAITPVSELFPLPEVKTWLVGMATYHGEIFPVTDLAGMLGGESTLLSKDARILILATQEEYSGLLVSRVLGLQRVIEPQGIDKLPEGLMAEYRPFVVGAMVNEQFQLPIISCKLIVRYPAFKDVVLNRESRAI